jgi:hypothetical protein
MIILNILYYKLILNKYKTKRKEDKIMSKQKPTERQLTYLNQLLELNNLELKTKSISKKEAFLIIRILNGSNQFLNINDYIQPKQITS